MTAPARQVLTLVAGMIAEGRAIEASMEDSSSPGRPPAGRPEQARPVVVTLADESAFINTFIAAGAEIG